MFQKCQQSAFLSSFIGWFLLKNLISNLDNMLMIALSDKLFQSLEQLINLLNFHFLDENVLSFLRCLFLALDLFKNSNILG